MIDGQPARRLISTLVGILHSDYIFHKLSQNLDHSTLDGDNVHHGDKVVNSSPLFETL